MVYRAFRYVLYPLLFACSTVLLGLTAYRIHYTESLSSGDILTTRTHFYDPRIAALLVASIVSLVFSMAMIGLMFGSFDILIFEHLCIWIIWIFLLITAALVTRQFSNLKYCRSHHKVCRILETIKAFGWICWGILTFLLILTLFELVLGSTGNRGTNRSTRGAVTAYPDTRQTATATPAATHDQPRTQPTQGTPTHGAPTKQNTSSQQQPHQTAPATTTAPGALYQQDIDHPAHTEPRHIV